MSFRTAAHWAYFAGPQSYRDAIRDHWLLRTKGLSRTKLMTPAGAHYSGDGYADDVADFRGDQYAGMYYPSREQHGLQGLEIPSTFLEKLSYSPAEIAKYLNHQNALGRCSWRETFFEGGQTSLPSLAMTPIVGHTYITFHRSGHPVAELIWDCDPTGSIESWSWQGDPAVIQMLAPLVENDTHMDTKWLFRIDNAIEQTGLTISKRHVGPPTKPKYGNGITTL